MCREAYASLHGIGVSRLRRIARAVAKFETPQDNRGRHNIRPRAITEELKSKIYDHITKFPFEESHYGRQRTKKRYLSAELSVRKMYVMFVEENFPEKYREFNEKDVQPEKFDCAIKYKFYFDFFKEHFNYGFGKPRTDVCGECEELKVKIGTQKNSEIRKRLELKLKIHKKKSDWFYASLKKCTNEAIENEEKETLCFDFQQNLPFPHLPVGEIFYKRQLWFYNFCVHSCTTGKPVMYTWPECFAKRGCNEVISCLHHYIKAKVPRVVKNLDLFCDGCRGQNHNNAMVRFLFTLVFRGDFEKITLHLPVRGHSFLSCDRHFGVIQRMKRKKDTVQHYKEWEELIQRKFECVEVKGNMISDYKRSFEEHFKKSVSANKEKFLVSKYKKFIFSATHKHIVKVSSSMSGLTESAFSLLKANERPDFPCNPVYSSLIPVKKAKLADVRSLFKYLREDTIEFISGIPEKSSNDDESDNDIMD